MSKKDKFPKKEVILLIQAGLSEGKTRQQIFEELNEKYEDTATVAKLVAMFPDSDLKQKYMKLNNILLAILVLTGILKVLVTLPLLKQLPAAGMMIIIVVPLINVLFAIEVYKMRGYIYNSLSLIALAGVFRTMGNAKGFEFGVFLDVVMLLGIAGYSFYVGKKLFPDYGLAGPKKDKSGQYRL